MIYTFHRNLFDKLPEIMSEWLPSKKFPFGYLMGFSFILVFQFVEKKTIFYDKHFFTFQN